MMLYSCDIPVVMTDFPVLPHL